MRRQVSLELWQIVIFVFGVLLLVMGLAMIIFWQRGLVQLKWLPCPKQQVPIAYGL